jgi:uncharacterized protein (TIGR00251 family)
MLRATPAGVTLAVRVHPSAQKTAITGIHGEGPSAQLKIAVNAPPIEGRANSALIAFLSELFAIPGNKVGILTGKLSRSKVFLIREVTLEEAQAILFDWKR